MSDQERNPETPFEAAAEVETSGDNRAASLDAGLTAAFQAGERVVVGDAGLSVLKLLGQTLDIVPRVALRESAAEAADPIVMPKSAEMPKHDSDRRYRLDGEIARGGMGAILKGRDTDLGRDLAIKVLLDQHKDKPDAVQRFVEEAQIGGQLQHPGVAPVYELGQFSDKRPFFSMKLVKGQTLLKQLAEREDASAERGRFIGIFEQVCQTMAYAHSRGVIHRDLKPANIMVGAFGEVQVMDWGLAKVLQAGGIADEKSAMEQRQGVSIIRTLRSRAGIGDGSDVPVVGSIGSLGTETAAGSVMGTPAYMPPEQALGETDNLDERADVFGLGAILCEILTGQPPYIGTDGTQVYRMATRGKLGDCHTRLDECGADAELIAITKQCLALEPKDRPRNAGVLADRVAAHLASVESRLHEAEVKRAAEAARAEEALQTAKEHELAASAERRARKLQMGLAAVVLCVMTIGGIAAIWTATEQSRLKNDALLAEQTANKARQVAETEQARAEREKTRAETEKSRAEIAQRQAEDEKLRSLNLLADMQTERGLQAAREGQAANAVLWFANAAALTPHDRERQVASQRRAQTWSGEAMLPVALLKVGQEARRIEFQPGGSLLMTVDKENVLRVWDWRNEVAAPWSEQFPAVTDAAMSPDGKTIATLLNNGEVRLLDPMTGEPNSLASGGAARTGGASPAASAGVSRTRFNTASGMNLIEWSPDGARVAVAGIQLQVWNVGGEPQRESDWPHPAKIHGVRFNRTGTRIVTNCEDHLARIFAVNDPNLPAPLFSPVEHRQESEAIPRKASTVFCDHDRLLVTISGSTYQPVLRDATTGQLQASDWKLSGYFNRSLEASPDGRWIAVGGSKDGALLSVDGRTSLVLTHANHLQLASFAPDGQSLMTLGFEGIGRLFPLRDLGQGKVGSPTIIPQQHTYANGAFSSESQALAIAADNKIVIWERKPAPSVVGQITWADHSWRPRPSFNGQLVTPGVYHEYYAGFAPRQAELKVARMADGSAAGPAIELSGLLVDSCICSDNASVAAVMVDGTKGLLSLFDIATAAPIWPALALPALPLSIAARPGRPQAAVLCEDGQVVVVDLASGRLEQIHAHPGTGDVKGPPTARVAYSPEGTTLVAVLPNQHVAIRDAQTGEPRCSTFTPLIQGGFTRCIAFSPDGRLLATAATGKNMAQVWSLATGEKVGVGMSHPGDEFGLWSIKFSPDGRRLATGHKDGRVRTFDWRTGEMVGAPLQHPDEVSDISFTPDGRHLLTCVRHATLHVWDVATGKLAVPLLSQLKQDGASTQSIGLAGNRVIVNSNTLYSVVELSTLLPPIEEDVPSLLRRAELATNQKLQVGELVPLESHEWSTRWDQLVAARQTQEQAAESLALALDEATNGAAQSIIVARASRRGLLERLHALRPKSLPVSLAVALHLNKQASHAAELELAKLTQAIELNPTETTGYVARATYLSRLGSWKESAADFNESVKLEPTNPSRWITTAALLLLAGDKDAHRDLCTRMLKQFLPFDPTTPAAKQAERADVISKMCLLVPGQVDRTLLPVTPIQEALDQKLVSNYLRDWFCADLGLIAYRDGDFARAAAMSAKSLELNNRSGFKGALALTILSMAQHQLQDRDSAVKSLDEATRLIPRELATLGQPYFRGKLPVATTAVAPDWLIVEILRREAALLIHRSETRTNPTAPVPAPTPASPEFDQAPLRDQLAMQGNWADAAKAATDDVKSATQDRHLFAYTASLLMLAGDVEGHRQFCDRALTSFDPITDAAVAESLCKGSLLSPDSVAIDRLPINAMRAGFSDSYYEPAWVWFRACNTLVLYREGKFVEAISETKKIDLWTGNVGALALVGRAMSEEKIGRHELALRTLAEAEALIPADLGTLGAAEHKGQAVVPLSTISVDWLIPEVLRREAAQLIRGNASPAPRVSSLLDSDEFKRASRWEQLAMQGQWAAAAKAAEADLEKSPPNRGLFAFTAAAWLLAGDVDRHRSFCDRAMKPFEPVKDAEVAESLCKASLLAPDAVKLERLPIKMMQEGITDPKHAASRSYFLACHTLTLYREGRHAEAIAETTKIPDLTFVIGALALTVRAMSEEKLGRHEQALRTLVEAEALIPADLGTLGAADHKGQAVVPLSTISVDWLIPEVLHREAARLIREE